MRRTHGLVLLLACTLLLTAACDGEPATPAPRSAPQSPGPTGDRNARHHCDSHHCGYGAAFGASVSGPHRDRNARHHHCNTDHCGHGATRPIADTPDSRGHGHFPATRADPGTRRHSHSSDGTVTGADWHRVHAHHARGTEDVARRHRALLPGSGLRGLWLGVR